MKNTIIILVLGLLAVGGGYYYLSNRSSDDKLEFEEIKVDDEGEIIEEQAIENLPQIPEVGSNIEQVNAEESVLKILCNNDGCNTEGVSSQRSDFYLFDNGKKIKVLVDIETKIRLVQGIDSETQGKVETVVKWADFYYLIEDRPRLGLPFSAQIYGNWIDDTIFRANWIKYSIG